MAPMKEMAFLEVLDFASLQTSAGVEEAVANVNGPDRQREQRRNPKREAHMSHPGESERPDEGHGGSVETGKMPKAKRSQYVGAIAVIT